MLVPSHFSSRASCQWRHVNVLLRYRWLSEIVASPTGHECNKCLGLKEGMLSKHAPQMSIKVLQSDKSTSYVARFPAEPKNDTVPSTICFLSVQYYHITCDAASVQINLQLLPSPPEINLSCNDTEYICVQCCTACKMTCAHCSLVLSNSLTCSIETGFTSDVDQ